MKGQKTEFVVVVVKICSGLVTYNKFETRQIFCCGKKQSFFVKFPEWEEVFYSSTETKRIELISSGFLISQRH